MPTDVKKTQAEPEPAGGGDDFDIDEQPPETPKPGEEYKQPSPSQADKTAAQAEPADEKAPKQTKPEGGDEEEMDLGLAPDEPTKATTAGGGETYSKRATTGRNTPERAKARSKEQQEEEEYEASKKRGYSVKNEELMKKIRAIMQEGKNFKVAPTHKDKALMRKLKAILQENKTIKVIKKNG